jgi:hypothetical protein
MLSNTVIDALVAYIALKCSHHIACASTRDFSGSLRRRLQSEWPECTTWISLAAANTPFLGKKCLYERFKGTKSSRDRDHLSDVGAVKQDIGVKKTMCIPGSEGITDSEASREKFRYGYIFLPR